MYMGICIRVYTHATYVMYVQLYCTLCACDRDPMIFRFFVIKDLVPIAFLETLLHDAQGLMANI